MLLRNRLKKKNEYPFSKVLMHELSELFFNEGYKLYAGHNSLALTAQFLSAFLEHQESCNASSSNLLRATARLSLNSSAREANYIRECFEKVQCLKIQVDPKYPFDQSIQLFPFNKLKVFVIKKCPIKQILGLKKLRKQLETIVISYSLTNVDELLTECGGDLTDAEEWSCLDELDISFNQISLLKNSNLHIAHSLTKLDISHNNLNEEFIDFHDLDNLTQVNIGFNFLVNVPLFHPNSMGSMHTLILRNNNISDIEGIQMLTQLHVLDIASNCIDLHTKLIRLDNLHFLQNLQLSGNPLSYHKKHRTLTLLRLSTDIDLETFLLDEIALTPSEKKEHQQNAQLLASAQSSLSSSSNHYFITSSSASPARPHNSTSSQGSSNRKSRNYASRKVDPSNPRSLRAANVVDFGHRDEIRKKEALRKQLGTAWLSSQEESPNKPKVKPKLKPTAHQHHIYESPKDSLIADDSLTSYSKPELVESQDSSTLPESQRIYQKNNLKGTKFNSKEDEMIIAEIVENKKVEFAKDADNFDEDEKPVFDSPNLIQGDQYLVYSYESDDEESQREPFFITLSGNRLIERNINGNIKHELDANCLISVTKDEKPPSDATNNEARIILLLTFNYHRRDMRKREYILSKDENYVKLFVKLNQFSISNNQKLPSQNNYHCLKCNAVYDKTQLLYSYAGLKEEAENVQDEDSTIANSNLQCPHCKSSCLTDDSKFTSIDHERSTNDLSLCRKPTPVEIRNTVTPIIFEVINDSLKKESIEKTTTPVPSVKSIQDSSNLVNEQNSVKSLQPKNSNITKKPSSYFSENKFAKFRDEKPLQVCADESEYADSAFEKLVKKAAGDEFEIITTPTNEEYIVDPEISGTEVKPKAIKQTCKDEKIVGKDSFRKKEKNKQLQNSSLFLKNARGPLKTTTPNIIEQSENSFSQVMYRRNTTSCWNADIETQGSNQKYSNAAKRKSMPIVDLKGELVGSHSSKTDNVSSPYNLDDPNYIRHDFKLYIQVKLFESNSEEFLCQIRCTAVQTRRKHEFECLLIISTQASYICQVKGSEETSPSEWLDKMSRLPLASLYFIDIGLKGQSFSLEFHGSKNASYSFIVRDSIRTNIFVAIISSQVSKLRKNTLRRVGNDLCTVPNFRSQVLEDRSPFFSEKYVLGLRLYEVLKYSSNLIKTHKVNKQSMQNLILGSQIADFLVQRGEVATIEEACMLVELCIKAEVLNPITAKHRNFEPDESVLYRFSFDDEDSTATSPNLTISKEHETKKKDFIDLHLFNEIEELETYVLGHMLEIKDCKIMPDKKPCGVAVTAKQVYLIEQNHQYPLPRLQAPPPLGMRYRQFEVLDQRDITDIEGVLVIEQSNSITISFSGEGISKSYDNEWAISIESGRMSYLLLQTIRRLWEEEFEVELTILKR